MKGRGREGGTTKTPRMTPLALVLAPSVLIHLTRPPECPHLPEMNPLNVLIHLG